MSAWQLAMEHWPAWALWGLVASAGMATLLEGAQLGGISRMSLPFLFGAFVAADRRRAIVLGYVLYLAGGWIFALLYALLLGGFAFRGIGAAALAGGVIGLAHGAFLVSVFLPLLPLIHPRLATSYDGPSALASIEPPGAFGLNYGRATPAVTVAAQMIYGLVLGLGYGAALVQGAA